MRGLSMTALSDHTRRAGEQRWRYSSVWDRKVAGNSLRRYALSKEEAGRRLAKARAVKAHMLALEKAGELDLSSRPRLR
jgi:hypothetical protein